MTLYVSYSGITTFLGICKRRVNKTQHKKSKGNSAISKNKKQKNFNEIKT